nr:radical SAM protein [candidate division Zixibacteria bacterium]
MSVGLKPSYYNFIFDLDDGTHLAFNAMTGAFARIKDDDYETVIRLLNSPAEFKVGNDRDSRILEAAKKAQFVIDEDYDEFEIIKFRANRLKYTSETFHLTIMPTLDCNFRCAYCYENFEKGKMPPENQEALCSWVDQKLKGSVVFDVSWFGGEPLMAFDVMDNLTREFKRLCKRRQVRYKAGITTNGYYLTPKRIEQIKELSIKIYQITIDGPPETHDKRRVLIDGRPTFARIMNNLTHLCNMIPDVDVKIRVNFDHASFVRIPELFPLIPPNVRSKSEIYFRQAFPSPKWWDKNEPSKKTYVTRGDKRLDYMILQNKAQDFGFKVLVSNYSPQAGYCEADYANHFVIDPKCYIHKCTVAFDDEHRIGKINPDGKVEVNVPLMARWLLRDTYNKDICRKCRILPLCMGGCGFDTLCSKNNEICSTINSESMTIENLKMLYKNHLIDQQRAAEKRKLQNRRRSEKRRARLNKESYRAAVGV